MKFKIGDKVRVKKDLEVGEYYGKFALEEGMKRFCGKEAVIEAVIYEEYELDIEHNHAWTDEMLEPATKDLDHLEEGDVLVRVDEEYKVLGVHKYCVHLSEPYDFEDFNHSRTIQELKDDGFKLKDQDQEEVTMSDVCAKFGRNVKIKKEE